MAYLTSGRNKIMGSSVSTDANIVTVIDENVTDEDIPSAKAVYDKLSDLPTDSGSKCYTTLDELGLTAPITVGEIFNAMSDDTMAVLACEDIVDHITDVPISFGVLTIKKNTNARFSIDYQNSLGGSAVNVRRWIGTLKGNDSTGLYWKELSTQLAYTTLSDLGLTTDATINDIIGAMKDGTTFTYKTDVFDYANEYNNIQYGTVSINKQSSARVQVLMTDKTTGDLYIGKSNSTNDIIGWQQMITENSNTDPYSCTKYTVLTGTEDLFTLPCGHYASAKADTAYNYPVTDSSNLLAHIYVLGCLNDKANNKGYRIILYFDNKNRMYRINEWWGNFTNNGWQEISSRSNIYYNLNQLNSAKGTSIELVNGEDNTLKIVEALGDGEEFTQWYNNNSTMERFGISNEFGHKITYLRIVKMDSKYALIIATTSRGFTFSRVYNVGVLEDWRWDKSKAMYVANTANFKLDVTKRNSAWFGSIKVTYLYDTSPSEIEIYFKGASDDLRWAVTNGQNCVKQITFTQDSSNTAHYTIGIEFTGKVYGSHQAEVVGSFADIDSFGEEVFTGEKTATRIGAWGKNNSVTLVGSPENLGLTYPCTTVQLAQAMRNRFNLCGAIGIFDNGGSKITDAPSEYGLLQINVYGYDRVMIRYDGMSGGSYTGSWIGQIKGSNGTFNSIEWERIDGIGELDVYSTSEQAIGTWIDGKTIYRKTFKNTSNLTTGSISQRILSGVDNVVNVYGTIKNNNLKFVLPYRKDESNYINLSLDDSGYFNAIGATGHSIYAGDLIVTIEYTKK